MPSSTAFVDAALKLGEQELHALENEDFDGAAALAERRTWLLTQAWAVRATADDGAYRERLEKMRSMQTQLSEKAQEKQAILRKGLVRSRQEGKRLAGYKKAMMQATNLTAR